MAAQKLASDIRLVQSYALGLKEFDFGSGAEQPGGGWGIYFEPNLVDTDGEGIYVVYADGGNFLCDSNCDSDSSERYSDIELLKDITVDRLRGDGGNANRIQLTYEPIEESIRVFINGALNYDWYYSATDNTIYFTVIPGGNDLVEIGYRYFPDEGGDTGDTGLDTAA